MRHEVISAEMPGNQLLFLPHIDAGRRTNITVAPNLTVDEMVEIALIGLPPSAIDKARVTIGDHVIERCNWKRVRPRNGHMLIIRLVPQGDNLRSILSVAVLVAAVALGQFYAPALFGGLTGGLTGFGGFALEGAAASVASAGLTTSIAIAGNLLINAIVPVRGLGSDDDKTSVYGITGLQNSAKPGGVVPSILGAHRYAPPYAATPYTQVVGTDQYVVAAFLAGHGPLVQSNLRLGDTPIANFNDVQIETRDGYVGDTPITLYPEQVIEEQLSVELLFLNPPTTRFTARDVASAEVDLTFVQGLVRYNKDGNKEGAYAAFRVRHRKVGDVEWVLQKETPVTGADSKILRVAYRWDFPTRGQYEVEVSRISEDSTDTRTQDKMAWSALRSFRAESPFNFDKPVSITCIRIKASSQLNGVVNNFNADYSLLCRDWDAATQMWIVRATSNPASLFRHVLQGPANAYPKSDAQIDLAGLQSWHVYCAAKGLTYNRVHDYNASRLDVLADIAAAGRATPHDDGTRWGVVVDRPRSVYVSAITPRNSWDFQGNVPFVEFPDGHRVKFIDATNGYQQAERIIPFPGVDPNHVNVTEEIVHPGITNPALIWKETRRRQYELLHRRGTYTVNMDIESLVISRGDLVPLNHDLLDRDHVAARVIDISGRWITIDTPVTMTLGQSYAVSFRLADGSTMRRSVVTLPGETTLLQMVGDLSVLVAGDLASFGLSVRGPVIDAVVRSIERGDNLTAKLTLIDAAPQIDSLVDADIPPPWDGRVGEVTDVSALLPAVPVITSVTSDDSALLAVRVEPGLGAIALPASYVVSYRAHGVGSYATITVLPAETAFISGYAAGDQVDVKARAVTAYGQASADTAVVVADLKSGANFSATNVTFDDTTTYWDNV